MGLYKSGAKPKFSLSLHGKKEEHEIITVKQAAQKALMDVQKIEYYITALATAGETYLDVVYPFQHDGEGTGPKFIVCNKKWKNFLKTKNVKE